ncbi:MAG TPA: hypothetical protein VMF64_15440 [Steroidobacteraceae bacterium]|nr:hypothetical protein [Steroidobacteraceae bacterium]
MRYLLACALILFTATAAEAAGPDYRTIRMQIDVDKPAAVVWAKVGHYCDISQWLSVDCKIVAGQDGIGTVRSLANGRVLEIMVGKTDLSYGYTQPAKAGAFYNLYHGYLEAKPLTRSTSRLVYTLFYDVSDKPDEAAKTADMSQRRQRFEAALKKMKQIAEQ